MQKHLAKYQRRVNHNLCLNFHVFWAAADTHIPREKWFSKYAQITWAESYAANVDILLRLHDILRLFNNCLKNYFNPNLKKKYKVVTSILLFSLINRRSRIRSFGRRAYGVLGQVLFLILSIPDLCLIFTFTIWPSSGLCPIFLSIVLTRLTPVLKLIFHQCVISYTCSQSNSDGSVFKQSLQS